MNQIIQQNKDDFIYGDKKILDWMKRTYKAEIFAYLNKNEKIGDFSYQGVILGIRFEYILLLCFIFKIRY